MSFGFVAMGAGLAVSAYGASKASKAQAQSTERIAESSDRAAQLSSDLGMAELDFAKQQYAENKPMADRIAIQQLGIMDDAQKQANDYYQYQTDTFRPLEQGLVRDAEEFSTAGARERFAGQAAADLGMQQAQGRDMSSRAMASMGVNPNSGRFAGVNRALEISNAGARAGATTNARAQAEELGTARRMNAAGLGRNLAANTTSSQGVSVGAGSSALQNSMAPGTSAQSGMNRASNTIMSGANSSLSAAMSMGNQSSPWASLAGGLGGNLMGAGAYKLMTK